jgi:hypothetical protein
VPYLHEVAPNAARLSCASLLSLRPRRCQFRGGELGRLCTDTGGLFSLIVLMLLGQESVEMDLMKCVAFRFDRDCYRESTKCPLMD